MPDAGIVYRGLGTLTGADETRTRVMTNERPAENGGPREAGTPCAIRFELYASLPTPRRGICSRLRRSSWARRSRATPRLTCGQLRSSREVHWRTAHGERGSQTDAHHRVWNDASPRCECSRRDSQACRLHSLLSSRVARPITNKPTWLSAATPCSASPPHRQPQAARNTPRKQPVPQNWLSRPNRPRGNPELPPRGSTA